MRARLAASSLYQIRIPQERMNITITIPDEQLEMLATMIASKLVVKSLGGKDSYTCKEAAARLGVHQETIRRQGKAGLIPRVPGIGKLIIPGAAMARLLIPES